MLYKSLQSIAQHSVGSVGGDTASRDGGGGGGNRKGGVGTAVQTHLDPALLHKTDLLHFIALVVENAFRWDNFFSKHNCHALYSVGRQILELRHLQSRCQACSQLKTVKSWPLRKFDVL